MRFALMIEPQQGLTYDEQLAVARTAEAAGFETLFRSDHYESFPGATGEPTTDAWAVLAGLARDTTTIGLGTLVSPVTFRTPGNLAKVAITVDEMSGGRVEVGVGAGWHEAEHRRHGFPFPEIAERADDARGDARDPPRPVGRARRLVVHRRALRDRRRALPAQAGVAAGAEGRPAADPRRAARGRRGRTGSRPAMPTSSTCPPRARRSRRRSTRRSTRRSGTPGASRRRSPTRAMVGVLMGRDRRRGPKPGARPAHGVRPGGRGRGLVRAAPCSLDPRHARQGAGVARGLRGGRGGADHAPGLRAPGPRDDQARGGVAVRLSAAARARGPRAPPANPAAVPLPARSTLGRTSASLAERSVRRFRGENRWFDRLAFGAAPCPLE